MYVTIASKQGNNNKKQKIERTTRKITT